MAELTVKLDPEALREATAQAIMGMLTPQLREEMLRSAITSVLTPSRSHYGSRNKSPLEEAFELAAHQSAREIVKNMMETDLEFQTKMKEVMEAAARKVLNCDLDKLSERMADAFVASMRRD